MRINKFTNCFFVLVFIVATLSFSLIAFGESISYSYDEKTNTLYINGSGDMEDYTLDYLPPWYKYRNECVKVVVSDDITSIGSYAFSQFTYLENVVIPTSVSSINFGAFARCESLNILYLSNNIISIADASFAYNDSVKKDDFVLYSDSGSYALHYAKENDISFDMPSTKCGVNKCDIKVKRMKAYYKYEAKVNGTFRIYSSGSQDTFGAVYDSDFNLITSNDDISDSNTNFSIIAQFEKGNTYYISANINSSGITGGFNLRIIPQSYELIFTINAQKNRAGDPSDILIPDAYVNGEDCSGIYTAQVTEQTKAFEVTYNGVTKNVIFTPDSDMFVTFLTVDVNSDGYVNAKDYSILKKNNSPYLQLYNKLISLS